MKFKHTRIIEHFNGIIKTHKLEKSVNSQNLQTKDFDDNLFTIFNILQSVPPALSFDVISKIESSIRNTIMNCNGMYNEEDYTSIIREYLAEIYPEAYI